jgi:hypothetical protein
VIPEYLAVYERFKAAVRALEGRGLWPSPDMAGLTELLDEAGDNTVVVGLLRILTMGFEAVLRAPPPRDAQLMDEYLAGLGPLLQKHQDNVLRLLSRRQGPPV